MANLFNRFWQPDTLPAPRDATKLEILFQKLDAAEKRISEYAHLIASLSAEIKGYQSIICHDCKEKVFRASLTSPSPPSATGIIQSVSHSVTLSSSEPASNMVKPSNPDSTWNSTRSLQKAAVPVPSITRPPPGRRKFPISTYNPPPISLPTTSATPPHVPHPASQPLRTASDSTTKSDWSVDYNPETKRCLSLHVASTFALPADVFCTKFSRDGKYLAVGLRSGETHIYDIFTGSKSILSDRSATVFYTEATEETSIIWAPCFSPDNKYIAIGNSRGQIKIWEIPRRHVRAIFKHRDVVTSLDISSDGRFLVSGSPDRAVCLWRIRDGSRRVWQQTSTPAVAFRPDGKYFAARINGTHLKVWDVRTGQLVTNHEIGNASTHYFFIAFTPDGKGIANGGDKLQCWDVGFLIDRTRHGLNQTKKIFESNIGQGSFTDVSFSPDGQWVISGCRDNKVYILDAQTGSWLCTLKGHSQPVWGAAFSPVGHYIVSGGFDSRVTLWKYEMVE